MAQFNFVGRLLGPRGNSLKRVEASTGCRVFIRGQGSIKDPEKVRPFGFFCTLSCFSSNYFLILLILHVRLILLKEESLRGLPGYEHLNEPLHVLLEAELPINIVDARLKQASQIIEELLRPVVSTFSLRRIHL